MEKIKFVQNMCPERFLKQRVFCFPESEQKIVLTRSVLDVFFVYRQLGSAPEAGGLLFAEFDFPIIRIVEASPPLSIDEQRRTLFVPNRAAQRQLIKQRFKDGLHFVGEWHSHSQDKPQPSGVDIKSMTDSFLKSKHELNYFIMIILGNSLKNLELFVSVHNGSNYYDLKEVVAN